MHEQSQISATRKRTSRRARPRQHLEGRSASEACTLLTIYEQRINRTGRCKRTPRSSRNSKRLAKQPTSKRKPKPCYHFHTGDLAQSKGETPTIPRPISHLTHYFGGFSLRCEHAEIARLLSRNARLEEALTRKKPLLQVVPRRRSIA